MATLPTQKERAMAALAYAEKYLEQHRVSQNEEDKHKLVWFYGISETFWFALRKSEPREFMDDMYRRLDVLYFYIFPEDATLKK